MYLLYLRTNKFASNSVNFITEFASKIHSQHDWVIFGWQIYSTHIDSLVSSIDWIRNALGSAAIFEYHFSASILAAMATVVASIMYDKCEHTISENSSAPLHAFYRRRLSLAERQPAFSSFDGKRNLRKIQMCLTTTTMTRMRQLAHSCDNEPTTSMTWCTLYANHCVGHRNTATFILSNSFNVSIQLLPWINWWRKISISEPATEQRE